MSLAAGPDCDAVLWIFMKIQDETRNDDTNDKEASKFNCEEPSIRSDKSKTDTGIKTNEKDHTYASEMDSKINAKAVKQLARYDQLIEITNLPLTFKVLINEAATIFLKIFVGTLTPRSKDLSLITS